MTRLHHENVIRLHGIVLDSNAIMLVRLFNFSDLVKNDATIYYRVADYLEFDLSSGCRSRFINFIFMLIKNNPGWFKICFDHLSIDFVDLPNKKF